MWMMSINQFSNHVAHFLPDDQERTHCRSYLRADLIMSIPDMKMFEFFGARVCEVCARKEHYVYLTRDEIEKFTNLLKETEKFPTIRARAIERLIDTCALLRMTEDKGRL